MLGFRILWDWKSWVSKDQVATSSPAIGQIFLVLRQTKMICGCAPLMLITVGKFDHRGKISSGSPRSARTRRSSYSCESCYRGMFLTMYICI